MTERISLFLDTVGGSASDFGVSALDYKTPFGDPSPDDIWLSSSLLIVCAWVLAFRTFYGHFHRVDNVTETPHVISRFYARVILLPAAYCSMGLIVAANECKRTDQFGYCETSSSFWILLVRNTIALLAMRQVTTILFHLAGFESSILDILSRTLAIPRYSPATSASITRTPVIRALCCRNIPVGFALAADHARLRPQSALPTNTLATHGDTPQAPSAEAGMNNSVGVGPFLQFHSAKELLGLIPFVWSQRKIHIVGKPGSRALGCVCGLKVLIVVL
jgi:hypothetical protein